MRDVISINSILQGICSFSVRGEKGEVWHAVLYNVGFCIAHAVMCESLVLVVLCCFVRCIFRIECTSAYSHVCVVLCRINRRRVNLIHRAATLVTGRFCVVSLSLSNIILVTDLSSRSGPVALSCSAIYRGVLYYTYMLIYARFLLLVAWCCFVRCIFVTSAPEPVPCLRCRMSEPPEARLSNAPGRYPFDGMLLRRLPSLSNTLAFVFRCRLSSRRWQ